MIKIRYSYTLGLIQQIGPYGLKKLKKNITDDILLKILLINSFLPDDVRKEADSLLSNVYNQTKAKDIFRSAAYRINRIVDWEDADIFIVFPIRNLALSPAIPIVYDVDRVMEFVFDRIKYMINTAELSRDARKLLIDKVSLLMESLVNDIFNPLSPLIEVARKQLIDTISHADLSYDERFITLELPKHPYSSIITRKYISSTPLNASTRPLSAVKESECLFMFTIEPQLKWSLYSTSVNEHIHLTHIFDAYTWYLLLVWRNRMIIKTLQFTGPSITSNAKSDNGYVIIRNPFELEMYLKLPQMDISKLKIKKIMEECRVTEECLKNIEKHINELDGRSFVIEDYILVSNYSIMAVLYAFNQDLAKNYLTSYHIGLSLFLEDLEKIID